MRPGNRQAPRKSLSVLVVAAILSSFFFTVPVASAASPTGDCGTGTFPGDCPAAVITTLPAASGSVSTTGLTTSNSGDLVIAVVIAGTSSDSIGTPTVGSTDMSGPRCSYSLSSGQVQIWYLYEAAAISNQVVSVTINGKKGDTIGIAAFGVNGASSTAALDGSCGSGSGTASPASVTISSLSYSNDFIVGGYFVAGQNSGVSGFSGVSPTNLLNSAVGSGSLKDGMASSYQTGAVGQTSQTVALSISGAFTNWTEVAAAIQDSTTQPVPLFPGGFMPLLIAMAGGYLLLRRSGRLPRRDADRR